MRVYQDKGNRISNVKLWGRGFNTHSGKGIGKLRYHVFPLNHNPDYNVIETEGTGSFNLCKGDSGGPIIKEVNTLELVAGVNSSGEFSSENCTRDGGDQWHTRINGKKLIG